LQVDSFFIKGQSHDICQDYALSGKTNNLTYAMISDGCSMLGGDRHPLSDVASRLVCLSAEKVLRHLSPREGRQEASELFFELLAATMRGPQKLLDKGTEIGDATLSLLTVKDDFIIEIRIGDGGLVIEREDYFELYTRRYTPNYPPLLSYLLSPQKFDIYNNLDIKAYETYKKIDRSGNVILTNIKKIEAGIGDLCDIMTFEKDDIISVSVFSDGLCDMVKENIYPVPVEKAMIDVMNIPNPYGEFVRRRLKGMKRREKKGIGPNDDLSMATIRI